MADRQGDIVPGAVAGADALVALGDIADIGAGGGVAPDALPLAGGVGLAGVDVVNELEAVGVEGGQQLFAGFGVDDFLFAPPAFGDQNVLDAAQEVAAAKFPLYA